MTNSVSYWTLILVLLAALPLSAQEDEGYTEIVNNLQSEDVAEFSIPIGFVFNVTSASFKNDQLESYGRKFVPELGLHQPGTFEFVVGYPILSGTRDGNASQKFANPKFDLNIHLFALMKRPQVDVWLLSGFMMGEEEEPDGLVSPLDRYKGGLAVVKSMGGFRWDMSGSYISRINESVQGLDAGDIITGKLRATVELLDGLHFGPTSRWMNVQRATLDGEELGPEARWAEAGPLMQLDLARGLRMSASYLMPVWKSGPIDEIEPTLVEPTMNAPREAKLSVGIQTSL